MGRLNSEIEAIPGLVKPCLDGLRAGLDQARELWRTTDPVALFTVARGSSDAAATYGAYRIASATGIVVGSFTPSLASMRGFVHTRGAGLLALGVSQSGASPDLVAAMGAFPAHARIALTNVDGSPMEQAAAMRLPIGAGEEVSVAATKSFACSLLAIDALAGAWGGEPAADAAALRAAALAGCAAPADLTMLADCGHCFTLGRGPTLALAQEAALKLKECAGLHAEALSSAEVYHGPKEIAGPELPVLAFVPAGPIGAQVEESVADLAAQGSPVLALGASTDSDSDSDKLAGMLRSLCSFYAALPALARQRGRDAEHPTQLRKVTLTT